MSQVSYGTITISDLTDITISSTGTRYKEGNSGTANPGGLWNTWSTNVVSVEANNYLWTWTKVVYSDGSETNSYSVSRNAQDGSSPTVTNTSYKYQQTENAQQPRTWSSSIPTPIDGYYMWTQTTVTYSDGGTSVSYNVARNGVRGTKWYSGDKITGTNPTAQIFSASGITAAVIGDMYLNTSTYNTYECTVAGVASVAKWKYTGNIKGSSGKGISSLNTQYCYSITDPNITPPSSADIKDSIEDLPGYGTSWAEGQSQDGLYYSRDVINWDNGDSATITAWTIEYSLVSYPKVNNSISMLDVLNQRMKTYISNEEGVVVLSGKWGTKKEGDTVTAYNFYDDLAKGGIAKEDEADYYGFNTLFAPTSFNLRFDDIVLSKWSIDEGLVFYEQSYTTEVKQHIDTGDSTPSNYVVNKARQGLPVLQLNNNKFVMIPNEQNGGIIELQTSTTQNNKPTGSLTLSNYEGRAFIHLSENENFLQSADYLEDVDSNYSIQGMRIDLNNGYIKTKNFSLNSSGGFFKGVIEASTGSIGGFILETDKFYVKSTPEATTFDFLLAPHGYNNIALSIGENFSVNTDGILTAHGLIADGAHLTNIHANNIIVESTTLTQKLQEYVTNTSLDGQLNSLKGSVESGYAAAITNNNQQINNQIENAKNELIGITNGVKGEINDLQLWRTGKIQDDNLLLSSVRVIDENGEAYILITSEKIAEGGDRTKIENGLKLESDQISFITDNSILGTMTGDTLEIKNIIVNYGLNFGKYMLEKRSGGLEGEHFSIIIN